MTTEYIREELKKQCDAIYSAKFDEIKATRSFKQKEFKEREKLYIALGLIRGCIYIEEIEDFSKEGLIKNLKKIQQILEEFLNEPKTN